MGLAADVWSSPTAIIISFADLAQGDEGVAQSTQVMRLAPGDVNLARLCEADDIADQVIDGEMELREGFRRLRLLGLPDTRLAQAGVIASYGLSAASIVALLLHSSWADLLAAALIGLMIGAITILAGTRPRLAAASDAICALVATTFAIVVSAYVVPLAVKAVVLASLIVLIPGMSLTTAVREMSSQHLVSGMARMGGAVTDHAQADLRHGGGDPDVRRPGHPCGQLSAAAIAGLDGLSGPAAGRVRFCDPFPCGAAGLAGGDGGGDRGLSRHALGRADFRCDARCAVRGVSWAGSCSAHWPMSMHASCSVPVR